MPSDFDSLRNAANERLFVRNVFDIDAYGWMNADDVDPDFIGFAIWTTSPPYDHDFESWQRNTRPDRAPTDVEQRLMELGHDFFGLMKTARHFIGFALLAQPDVQTLRIEPNDFDFNEFAALVTLTSAFDRLRDFIIVATQGKKTEERNQFNNAIELLRACGLNDEADRLRAKHVAVRKVREARNVTAHGLGTQPARVQRRLIDMDREAFADGAWRQSADSITHEELMGSAARADIVARADVERRIQLLCDCYRGLVNMCDACFRAEYAWRHRRKP